MIATRKKKSKPSKGQSLQGIGRGIGPRNNQQALSSQLSRENNKRKKKKRSKAKRNARLMRQSYILYIARKPKADWGPNKS
jgi:hypothetical protein